MIGYKAQNIPLNSILKHKKKLQIKLKENVFELSEAVVNAKKLKRKVIGNKSQSKFLSTGFFYHQLGAEMGIKINIKSIAIGKKLLDNERIHTCIVV